MCTSSSIPKESPLVHISVYSTESESKIPTNISQSDPMNNSPSNSPSVKEYSIINHSKSRTFGLNKDDVEFLKQFEEEQKKEISKLNTDKRKQNVSTYREKFR